MFRINYREFLTSKEATRNIKIINNKLAPVIEKMIEASLIELKRHGSTLCMRQ